MEGTTCPTTQHNILDNFYPSFWYNKIGSLLCACDILTTFLFIGFSETGELNLPRKTLSAWVWESLGGIITSSVTIRVLNFSDCLIPPRGLTALLAYLSRDCSVESLILRGNAIQTTNVAYLGTVLRQNCNLKR